MINKTEQEILKILGITPKNITFFDLDLENENVILRLKYAKIQHLCPRCLKPTKQVHDVRKRTIKSSKFLNKNLIIHYFQQRYLCTFCQKRFIERNDIVYKYKRISIYATNRLMQLLSEQLTYSYIAKAENISPMTVIKYFDNAYLKNQNAKLPSKVKPNCQLEVSQTYKQYNTTLPNILSLDEIKVSKFTPKYAVVLLDFQTGELIDIVKDRRNPNLDAYFAQFPLSEREKVRFITMDLWKPYKTLAKKYFPNAEIIADKFHYQIHLNWLVRDTRISVLSKTTDKTLKTVLKKHWKIVQTPFAKLSGLVFNQFQGKITSKKVLVLDILDKSQQISEVVQFYSNFWQSTNRQTSYSEAKVYLNSFLDTLKLCLLPKSKEIYQMFKNWKLEIINSLCFSYHNSKIEGKNNFIKTANKIAYGFRNFDRFKTRVIYQNNSKNNQICKHFTQLNKNFNFLATEFSKT